MLSTKSTPEADAALASFAALLYNVLVWRIGRPFWRSFLLIDTSLTVQLLTNFSHVTPKSYTPLPQTWRAKLAFGGYKRTRRVHCTRVCEIYSSHSYQVVYSWVTKWPSKRHVNKTMPAIFYMRVVKPQCVPRGMPAEAARRDKCPAVVRLYSNEPAAAVQEKKEEFWKVFSNIADGTSI